MTITLNITVKSKDDIYPDLVRDALCEKLARAELRWYEPGLEREVVAEVESVTTEGMEDW